MKDTPFTEARLLSLYDRVAEAEDAIPRLRRFVLDLAVRGKLVPQEAGDEPASVLLDQVTRTTKKPTAPASQDFPFTLPSGWAWSDVGGLCTKTGSGSTPRGGREVYTSEGIPFLRSQNVYDHGLVLNDVAYIATDVHERMAGTHVLPSDLLLNITGGSMGRCCRVPDKFEGANVSQHVAIIRGAVKEMADFLHLVVRSPYFQGFIFGEQTGAGRGGLPKNRMDRIVVAVPPLTEQHRIVAKVEELMALLDRLEAARAAREETRTRLTAAALSRLTETDTDTPTAARFALQTLPALTTRPDQIKTLRQTILNLAVRGKLVEQEPEDEPASVLLKRIEIEKARLFAEGITRRPKVTMPVLPHERPFDEPRGWVWSRLASIALITQGFAFSSGDYSNSPNDGYPLIKIGDIGSDAPEVFIKGEVDETYLVQPGDLLLGLSGSIKCAIWQGPLGLLNQRIARLRPVSRDLSNEWLFLIVNLSLEKWKAETSKLTVQNVKADQLNEAPVPLPPLAEQHRIVAKVEEIMSLCDRLERAMQDASTARARLLDATLRDALAGAQEAA